MHDEAAPEYGPAPQLLCESQMHELPSHTQPLHSLLLGVALVPVVPPLPPVFSACQIAVAQSVAS